MAHQPAIRPDVPPDDPADEARVDPQFGELDLEQEDPSLVLAELARSLALKGGGNASADLALDLVLNEIVQQACLATTASGAAVALIRDAELTVRATTGINAPELGVRLSMEAGLSGACLRTGEVQLCDDSQLDARVDALTCAELDIHSILAVPIADANGVLGILEIFSNRSHAFGDRDEQTLRALARRIVNTIQTPAHTERNAAKEPEVEKVFVQAEGQAKNTERTTARSSKPRRSRGQDYSTLLLTISIIAAALLLGWMSGRSAWQTPERGTSEAVAPRGPASGVTVQGVPAEPVLAEPPPVRDAKPPSRKNVTPAAREPIPAPGLVVYDKGKIIFQSAAQRAPEAVENSATPTISSAIAGGLLLSKVAPEYPEQAKERQIEGPVHLAITVGPDGLVRDAAIASGNSLLANAAVTAVRQWRFRPYAPAGKATAFRTSVTVKFSLSGTDHEIKTQ
ncbi:MAG TPA: TonB family protein [Terriglobales bacterium]|nr:TonB family protein [Terriglobales bacterium]